MLLRLLSCLLAKVAELSSTGLYLKVGCYKLLNCTTTQDAIHGAFQCKADQSDSEIMSQC